MNGGVFPVNCIVNIQKDLQMNELALDGSSEKDNESVIIEGKGGTSVISMQAYQDIYNQITGKTEEITKIFKNPIRVEYSDIYQLDLQIKQVLEQWNIISFNSTFTIYFDKNQKEAFSSIERFAAHNKSSNNQTENVVIKYNFLAAPPQTGRAQNYTVFIKINSRIVTHKKIADEIPFKGMYNFLNFLASKTAEIQIEFVDYVYARTLMTAFDDWMSSLEETKGNKIFTVFKAMSALVPIISKYVTLFLAFIVIYSLIPMYTNSENINQKSIFEFALCSAFGTYVAVKIASVLGNYIESSIDSTCELSYVKLTKGDEKHISEACNNNRTQIIKAILGIIATAILNAVAKYILAR